jgi:hypothetical protein
MWSQKARFLIPERTFDAEGLAEGEQLGSNGPDL